MDWMSRERKTEVTCAKIVHCSAGNQNSLTAKACEAISTVAHAVQLGAPLVSLIVSASMGFFGISAI